jgi:hypothetical protein
MYRPTLLLLAAFGFATLSPAIALADDDPYTLEIVGADALSVATLATAAKVDSDVLLFSAAGLYLVGGPVIHLLHEEHAEAGISLAARVVGPVAGAALGLVAARDCKGWACLGAPATGMVVGGLAAMIVDWALLSRTEDSEDTTERKTMMLRFGGQF